MTNIEFDGQPGGWIVLVTSITSISIGSDFTDLYLQNYYLVSCMKVSETLRGGSPQIPTMNFQDATMSVEIFFTTSRENPKTTQTCF